MQTSFLIRVCGAALLVGGVAACQPAGYGTGLGLSPDAQRAAGGAVAGAVVAKALDEKASTGALIGGAAGALCDDVGVCAQ